MNGSLRVMPDGWRAFLGFGGFDYLAELDREARYLDISPNYSELLGLARAQILGRTPYDLGFLHSEDLDEINGAVAPMFNDSQEIRFTYRMQDGKGRLRWMETTGSPFMTPQGEWRTLIISRDVSELRNSQFASEQESRILSDIIELNPLSIQVLDAEGRTLRVNAAHTRLFQAVPPPDYSIFEDPLLLRQGLGDLLKRVRQGEVVLFPEFRHNPREIYPEFPDCPVWIRMVAFPILGKDGQPERYVLMHEDITERRRAEAALRESEERFQGLYLNTTDAIFWVRVDGDGHYCFEGSNPAHEAMFKIAKVDYIGKRPEDMLAPEEAARITSRYRACMQKGEPTEHEETLHTEDGLCHLQTLLVPIRDASGRIYRIVGTIRDITRPKQTEEILRQAQKLESLGILAGGIAHDFNNLLTAILGNLNLAQLKLSPEAPAQPHLEAVERTVLKASELTRQMLAYSGKGRFVVKHHDLNEVVHELTHLLQVSIPKKVSLRMKLQPDLPCINADVTQIQQVIMNLVTNAADAIGDQDGVISIVTHQQELDASYIAGTFTTQELAPGRYATLEVSDTGCGIPPEILEKIFDPFFTTKASGRGLGLSAMLGILRGHGGGFKIYSEPGKGTTFKVFLPAVEGRADVVNGSESVVADRLQGCVLVVDDEPTIRESVQAALENYGMRVLTAADGQEAVECFRREHAGIDLVLMDLTMPRMDGREAFLVMRTIHPGVRVVLSSGYNEQESLQEFLGKGLAGFIQKPYQLKDLKQVVARALGGK